MGHGTAHCPCYASSSFSFWFTPQSHFALHISTTLWPRNVTLPPDFSNSLHSKMLAYNNDFIGGDFNMSAFSTVSDVFSDPEFFSPGIHACGDLALRMNNIENVLAFLSCPSVHMNGVWIRMAAIQIAILRLPVFLHLRNTNIPGPSSDMRSEQAQQRRL